MLHFSRLMWTATASVLGAGLLALAAAACEGGEQAGLATAPPGEASPPTAANGAGVGASPTIAAGPVRLNQIQVIGTHNSYHIEPGPLILATIRQYVPDLARSLEYSHLPLAKQFETQGVRGVELDVFADPAGGLFANPAGRRLVGLPNPLSPELLSAGFKVFHIQDIDVDSTCFTFVACLRGIKEWSDRNAGHVPIIILVETKDDVIPDLLGLGFVTPRPIGAAELDALDAEIRSVFTPERLITPDDVRGQRATLEEAVLRDGWPVVAAVRGRVMFALINGGSVREAYRAGRPSLERRAMFTSSERGKADAAFIKVDDALGQEAAIQALVAAGYLVRTRADADTAQARTGDTSMREAALASGAQLVSTDYPVADPRFGTGYAVSLGTGLAARCNPVVAPPACRDQDLEPAR